MRAHDMSALDGCAKHGLAGEQHGRAAQKQWPRPSFRVSTSGQRSDAEACCSEQRKRQRVLRNRLRRAVMMRVFGEVAANSAIMLDWRIQVVRRIGRLRPRRFLTLESSNSLMDIQQLRAETLDG